MEAPSLTPLQWGRCRYMTGEEGTCRRRRRRRPRFEEKSRLPSGTLLLSTSQHGLVLCRTQSPFAVETADDTVTLCFDESVKLVVVGDLVNNDQSRERALSILDAQLLPERFLAQRVQDNDEYGCSDSSHQHLSMKTTPESSRILDYIFVASFSPMPGTLLSISLLRMDESHSESSSPLGQACLKRQLVGCHCVFADKCLTTQISLPFEGHQVCFRVTSVLPTPKKSRTAVRQCCGDCESKTYFAVSHFVFSSTGETKLVRYHAKYSYNDYREQWVATRE